MISARTFQLSVGLVMWAAVSASGLTSMSLSLTESSCETLPSAIHISKEENDENGRPVRTCEGDVTVSKCEGTCTSQLQPSVITTSGFIKDCQCCRESTLREREVALIKCYDPDGQILTGDTGRMMVRLREPSQCKCYKCGE